MKTFEITFYYQIQDRYAEQHIYAVKKCKSPKKTNIWKQLEHKFNKGEISVYGYKTNQ